MKLVIAIVNHDDANTVIHALTNAGFSSTKLATTGGFLMAGNATVLTGVEDNMVQQVIDIIREHCHSRRQIIPAAFPIDSHGGCGTRPLEVNIGGATVFVVDVERFERL